MKKSACAVFAMLWSVTTIAAAADLMDARSILRSTESASAVPVTPVRSKSAQLLNEIETYRSQAGTLTPEKAASEWFALLDRAIDLGVTEISDYESYDPLTQKTVGVRSVIASLPPPAVWPALRKQAQARTNKSPKDVQLLAQRLLTETLNQDSKAVQSTLAEIEAAAATLEPDEHQDYQRRVAAARASLAEIYGTPEDVATAFTAIVERAKQGIVPQIEVPDLVGLIGKDRSRELLRQALATPAELTVAQGDETRVLARQVALDNAAKLRVPQWRLVNSIDADALYEMLLQRFGNQAAGEDAQLSSYDYHRSEADVFYLLSKIVAGQQSQAENTLLMLAGRQPLRVPKEAVAALRRAHQNEALVNFLQGMLSKRPDLQAWEVYFEQASYVGKSAQALALINQLLEQKDLSPALKAQLARRKADALLAANRLDEGIAELRKPLAGKPKATDKSLEQSTATAVRLAQIGRLLNRPQLTQEGLAYAEAALALEVEGERPVGASVLEGVWSIYRRTGKPHLAQALAVRELKRPNGPNSAYEQFGIPIPSPERRAALVELVGLFGAEKRYTDVLTLLDESKQWGARDLSELMETKDSLGVPVGLVAARALAANGQKDVALNLTRELIDRMPGNDSAYELLVELTGDGALSELDALFARDAFEERPLIWKAQALKARAQWDEAERIVRRAIEIDPSDGEQGKSDRMRAYAILADVLEAKSDVRGAITYRNAIEAIRISENADDFHAVGLYDRAFTLYQQALSHFADAYCIQSRLAIQLMRQGRHTEALAHYKRAYELMPESFGRVESHCFGCESAFEDAEAQGIAEAVFRQAIDRGNAKPQVHYLLGYLREQQGQLPQAVQRFREAVAMDDQYLNAWKHLNALGDRTYLESDERDIASFKLLSLDPRHRHAEYKLDKVRDLSELWRQVERAASTRKPIEASYRLKASADQYDGALAQLPSEIRAQMQRYLALMESTRDEDAAASNPSVVLSKHVMIGHAAELMGDLEGSW